VIHQAIELIQAVHGQRRRDDLERHQQARAGSDQVLGGLVELTEHAGGYRRVSAACLQIGEVQLHPPISGGIAVHRVLVVADPLHPPVHVLAHQDRERVDVEALQLDLHADPAHRAGPGPCPGRQWQVWRCRAGHDAHSGPAESEMVADRLRTRRNARMLAADHETGHPGGFPSPPSRDD
jgi:hypothetical protein